MVTSLLRFIWIAFREYWGVWVTGTGLVGLSLWGLSFTQNITGWKMRPRHYIIVLFCVFWFLATFSAWHDADKNLTSVIQQRAQDVSDLSSCRGDLKTADALLEQAKAQNIQQQGTINSLQTSFNSQQGAVNNCVVSLGKMNPLVNAKINALPLYIATQRGKDRFGLPTSKYLFALIIMTNRTLEPIGDLKCDNAFSPSTPRLTTQATSAMVAPSAPVLINDHEYEIRVSNTGASWTDENPIFMSAFSPSPILGKCSFTPQK